jgi:hypothetical protein
VYASKGCSPTSRSFLSLILLVVELLTVAMVVYYNSLVE